MTLKTSSEFIINKEWRITRKIGAGSFGEIYSCVSVITDRSAAVKVEKYDEDEWSQLELEHEVLRAVEGRAGFCSVYWYGRDGVQGLYRVLVMEQLGPSLDDLLAFTEHRFSVKTVAMLADQMLKRLQTLHSLGVLHRDVKPENFLMGQREAFNTVYIIDFGLSKQFLSKQDAQHIPFRTDKSLTGTARYCSLNTHEGYEQSRRDDLESLGLVLVYLLQGRLPWQGLPAQTSEDKFAQIHSLKKKTSLDELCVDLPLEISAYIAYCRELHFKQEPDYLRCRKMFWAMMERLGLKYDFQFDWLLTTYY